MEHQIALVRQLLTPIILLGLAALVLVPSGLGGTAAAQPAPDYRSRTIYFLVADRFHAHEPLEPYVDPDHPDATNDVNCFEQTCPDEAQWRRYWGGDVQGIIDKLDYVQRLGASAVWVTPLMENVAAYEGGTGYGTSYHGYWVQNYDAVNPHFGTWADVSQLSQALHARGMRYIQDITLNHSNPNDNHAYGQLDQLDGPSVPFIRSYAHDYDPATGRRFYKHYQNTAACQAAQKVADSEWDDWQLHHCLLADLSGYDQRNPTMAAYLIAAGKLWLDNGVDDFRLDAIKFPFPEFVARFTHELTDHTAAEGREAPYFVGEWSNGGVGDDRSLAFANHYDVYGTNILDFQLALALNRFIGGSYEEPAQATSGADLDALLQQRTTAFDGRDDWQGTFIDNHDQMRTLVRLQKLGIQSETERERRLDLATVLLMTVRGIPIIFYGDEQYLARYDEGHDTPPTYINSDNDDPYNRLGMTAWSETTPAFEIIQALARLRQSSAAVWQGTYQGVYTDADVLVFERRSGADTVLVAVNRGDARTVELTTPVDLPPGAYTGVLARTGETNAAARLAVRAGGGATLTLGRLGAFVARSGEVP
ncbi:MAG: alpha amylase C-terminal domain-containing protein [Chloroflexi bacterium]|nr:alpha amylase C-terminal domain-containing protein [Chloroflexota bacterium]